MNTLYPFILTIISALGTLLGSLLVFVPFKHKNVLFKHLLRLCGFILLFLSLFDLLPNGLIYIFNNVFILYGIVLLLIVYILGNITYKVISKSNNNTLCFKSFLILFIHNVPEGIITYLTYNINSKLGITMALVILIHNIPEGLLLTISSYLSDKSYKKGFIFALVSSFAEPIGALIAFLFLRNIKEYILGFLLVFVVILMVNLAINDLIKNYKK